MTRFDLLRPAPEISRRPAQQIVPPVIDACHYCGGSDVDDGSTVSLLSGGWAHEACHSAHVLAAIAEQDRPGGVKVNRTFCAIIFGYEAKPQTEWFETEADAITAIREAAETYLDAGERIPMLEEWAVVRLTHNMLLHESGAPIVVADPVEAAV